MITYNFTSCTISSVFKFLHCCTLMLSVVQLCRPGMVLARLITCLNPHHVMNVVPVPCHLLFCLTEMLFNSCLRTVLFSAELYDCMIALSELETVLEVSILRCFLTLSGCLTRVVEENHAEN
jgi:hypothetical protein